MRRLIPNRLVVVGEFVWAVDGVQPVAAILDPSGGDAPRLVSWGELPPAPMSTEWPRAVHACGSTVHVQEAPGGPVARVGAGGVEEVHWADGHRLAASGPGSAWLVPDDQVQWVMPLAQAHDLGLEGTNIDPADLGLPDQGVPTSSLVRCDADGVTRLTVEGEILSVRTGPDGLDIEVDAVGEEARLRLMAALDAGSFDPAPESRWFHLSWEESPPIVGAAHEIPVDFAVEEPWDATIDVPEIRQGPWWSEPLEHAGLRWRAGRVTDDVEARDDEPAEESDLEWRATTPGPTDLPLGPGGQMAPTFSFGEGDLTGDLDEADDVPLLTDGDTVSVEPLPIAVVAHRPDGSFAHCWDLGTGRVTAMVAVGDGVIVIVDRAGPTTPRPGPAEVIAVRPDVEPQTLLADLDITASCRPLVPRPPETDSYIRQIVRRFEVPDLEGVTDPQTRVVGEWPTARLEWTFAHPARPGVRLRRRFDLFDELGRLAADHDTLGLTEIGLSDVHLMEDLAIDAFPPIDRAVDGVLDI